MSQLNKHGGGASGHDPHPTTGTPQSVHFRGSKAPKTPAPTPTTTKPPPRRDLIERLKAFLRGRPGAAPNPHEAEIRAAFSPQRMKQMGWKANVKIGPNKVDIRVNSTHGLPVRAHELSAYAKMAVSPELYGKMKFRDHHILYNIIRGVGKLAWGATKLAARPVGGVLRFAGQKLLQSAGIAPKEKKMRRSSARKSLRKQVEQAVKEFDSNKHPRDQKGRFSAEPDFEGGAEHEAAGYWPSATGYQNSSNPHIEPSQLEIMVQQEEIDTEGLIGNPDIQQFTPQELRELQPSSFEQNGALWMTAGIQDDPSSFGFDKYHDSKQWQPAEPAVGIMNAGYVYGDSVTGLSDELKNVGGKKKYANLDAFDEKFMRAFGMLYDTKLETSSPSRMLFDVAPASEAYNKNTDKAVYVVDKDTITPAHMVEVWRRIKQGEKPEFMKHTL